MRGHFRIEARASIFVVVMPDDHHPVVMMPAVIAMFAILGACVAIAMPDDDGFGTGDRRGRYSNGNNRRNDISKLLHGVLFSSCAEIEHQTRDNVPPEPKENSEQMFSVN